MFEMRICVVGGGIIGLTTAVQLLEYFGKKVESTGLKVTVISEKFSPQTTGDGSAGLWGPYLLKGTPAQQVYKWSKEMHQFLESLWLSKDAGEAGICLIPVIRLTTSNNPIDDFWKDIVYGCNQLTSKQLAAYNKGGQRKFTSALSFVSYTSEPMKLLPYLMKRFQRQGGSVIQQKVDDLLAFAMSSDYNIIVNCTGLGSRQLLGDTEMQAIRGQVRRVKAPWLYSVILDESDDGNYIIPNMDSVVLGGTHQVDDYNVNVSSDDKDFITKGCLTFSPSLSSAKHLYDWVGLRPGRTTVRLEVEYLNDNDKIIIHNYGHGGSGVTLAWGCAKQVIQLIEEHYLIGRQIHKSKL